MQDSPDVGASSTRPYGPAPNSPLEQARLAAAYGSWLAEKRLREEIDLDIRNLESVVRNRNVENRERRAAQAGLRALKAWLAAAPDHDWTPERIAAAKRLRGRVWRRVAAELVAAVNRRDLPAARPHVIAGPPRARSVWAGRGRPRPRCRPEGDDLPPGPRTRVRGCWR